ncbi:MAG TPA: hypothetical protein VGV60_01565 [Candidatus Polarisedimenticolia bacterium]|nr:hypothetical protein [Candidatus Polarisedimenticolia bacterium]
MNRGATLARARDFILYILIGVAAVGAMIGWAYYQAKTGGPPDPPMKWFAFAAVTAIAFGYVIKGQRRNWRNPKFWVALGVLAVGHLAMGIYVVWRLSAFPLILLGALAGGEYVAIALCLEYLVPARRES